MKLKKLKKYIKGGITITGSPKSGYGVFTIPTQHFMIESLDELTPKRFKEEIKNQIKAKILQNKIKSEWESTNLPDDLSDDLSDDLAGYADGID